MKKTLLLFFSILISHTLYAQAELGKPLIVNYSNEQYPGGIQNWSAKQDKVGNIYFGNNEGLLSFNGRYWNLFKLPNNTSVRSIGIDSKNRIYVGAQDEIGYFFPDENGVLKYTSLVPLVDASVKKFADVWDITILNDEVFFRTKTVILHFKGGIIKSYKPSVSWEYLGQVNGKIYAHSLDGGLLIFDNEIWKPVSAAEGLKNSAVSSMIPYSKDIVLVTTLKNGVFLLKDNVLVPKKTSLDSIFYNERIYTAIPLSNNRVAIGTTSGGVYIINKEGSLLQQYNAKKGLPNNNIRGILLDQHKNMWLALDDGVAYIAINSAIKHIVPDLNTQITSYAFHQYKNALYIGTSNGLYVTPIQPGINDLSLARTSFREVKNTRGQVWNLDEVNNQLLMGHEDGTFSISEDIAHKIGNTPGTWVFQPMSYLFPAPDILAGTYLGLQKLSFKDGEFSNEGLVKGLSESLRFIVLDNRNNLWSSHPFHGVYKIDMAPGFKKISKTTLFTQKDGLPSTLYNYVYRIKNRVLVATLDGIYEFNPSSNRFVRFKLLKDALKGVAVQYMKEDQDGNIWFVSGKKLAVIDFSGGTDKKPFKLIHIPELDGKVVGGFERVYSLNNKNVFIGSNKGAYHINYARYLTNISKPDVSISAVKLIGKSDSLVFGGYYMNEGRIDSVQDLKHVPAYSYAENSIHFEFSSTILDNSKLAFSYQLVGFDREWSPWTTKTEKDYTNLPAGRYTFKVRAQNDIDNQSNEASFTFVIKPAWYNTVWMYVIYVLIIGLLLRQFFLWQKKKHKTEQDRLSYLHQLELNRTEKEIVRLEKEKLKADVDYKNKELSTLTTHLVQRGKVLSKIKEVISTVIKSKEIPDSSQSFRHLLKLIRDVERGDNDLDQLTMHFNSVNSAFFNKLKDSYPELSPNDLKFCAYLRLNLSSKEMAQLMNVTIKAIEVGRYRLRKKLKLKPETNLFEFLTEFSRESIS
jgi:ligand-binding sensor domain-containing protein